MIEILKYETLNDPSSKTIAHVTVKLPKMNNLIIRRISHVRGNDDRTWFNLPTFKKDDEYLRFFEFENKEINTALLKGIGESLKKYLASEKPIENDEIPF